MRNIEAQAAKQQVRITQVCPRLQVLTSLASGTWLVQMNPLSLFQASSHLIQTRVPQVNLIHFQMIK